MTLAVFSGERLRATAFAPEGPARGLFVTFRHRIPDPGSFADASPVQTALKQGLAHLHIQSRLNDWFINAETEALAAALHPFCSGFAQARAIGFSMGGYGALRFSAALRLTHATVVSPQASIHPDVVPFDTRFRAEAAEFDAALGDLATHAAKGLRGAVIFDPFRPLDRRNADMIAQAMPGLDLCRFAFCGHPALDALREAARFPALQRLALTGKSNPATLAALHRESRVRSPSYWHALSEAARRRPALAVYAKAQASQFQQQKI
jgi:hypothetical protein